MQGEQLKEHRKKLETAINQALVQSPQVEAAIQSIRDEGFDVFLIIEATIGFNRLDESAPPRKSPDVRLELTTHDEKFLKSLKIAPE